MVIFGFFCLKIVVSLNYYRPVLLPHLEFSGLIVFHFKLVHPLGEVLLQSR